LRAETIARNYAEALFELGDAAGQAAQYADLLDAVASAVETSPEVRGALMSPRVPKSEKIRLVGAALEAAPREFVLFIQAVVKRNRQMLLREIATEYLALVDVKLNRVRAAVTLARPADDSLRQAIQARLAEVLGKEVIASYHVDPEILGGTVVRVGERVHDGSLRRRLVRLRRQLLSR
jgi:F-type H+-transporting ATPase subunit delta